MKRLTNIGRLFTGTPTGVIENAAVVFAAFEGQGKAYGDFVGFHLGGPGGEQATESSESDPG